MRSDNWLGRIWSRFHTSVVQDVPPSLEACESCREVDCSQERWEACEHRLAAEAAHPASAHSNPAKTGERPPLPGLAPHPPGEATPMATPEPAAEPRTKKISVH
jgi:hypothetical protein